MSTFPVSRSPPSTLPAKLIGSPPCGGSASSSSYARRASLLPLPGSAPMVSSPTARLGQAPGHLDVGHAELGELDQHLGLGVGDRPGVEQQRGRGPGGQHHGQRGPGRARQRAQPQPGGGHDGAGRPGRHDGRGLAAVHELARDGDAGPRPAPAAQRTLLHADRLLGGHHRDQVGGIVAGQQRAQQARAAGQGDADLMLADGDDRARHDLLGRVIAAHRVHRDQRRAPGRGARNRAQRLGRVRLLVGGLRSGGQRREGGGGGALGCRTGRYRTRQRRLGRLRRRGRLRSLPHAAKPLILRGRRGGRCPTRPGRVLAGNR